MRTSRKRTSRSRKRRSSKYAMRRRISLPLPISVRFAKPKRHGTGLVWVAYYGDHRYIVRFRVPKKFGQRGFWSEHKTRRAAWREAGRAAKSLERDFHLTSVRIRM